MTNLYRIAVNSFRESVREPVYFLMLLGALLIIGHYPWMTLFVFFEQLKLVVDGAMATTLLFSLAVCVLCATSTVSREMRNGTVLLLLSKPVSRWSFVLGKIAGIAAASLLFCGICACASVISVYIAVDQFRMNLMLYGFFVGVVAASCLFGMLMNYLRGASFGEFATYAALLLVGGMLVYCFKFQDHPMLSLVNLAKALFLLAPAVVVMAVWAVGCATRLDVVPAMGICTILFFLGLMSSYFFQNATGTFWGPTAAVLYAVIPNWQYFWMADTMAVNKTIPTDYVWWCIGYAALYSALGAAWATVFFLNREAVGDSRN